MSRQPVPAKKEKPQDATKSVLGFFSAKKAAPPRPPGQGPVGSPPQRPATPKAPRPAQAGCQAPAKPTAQAPRSAAVAKGVAQGAQKAPAVKPGVPGEPKAPAARPVVPAAQKAPAAKPAGAAPKQGVQRIALTPAQQAAVKPELIDCMKRSFAESFSTACNEKLLYAGEEAPGAPFEGALGVITLSGDINWGLVLGFPKPCVPGIAQVFAGFEVDYGSSDVVDLVGELANVFVGNFGTRLARTGVKTDLGLPKVLRVPQDQMPSPGRVQLPRMRFKFSKGVFWAMIGAS